MQPLAYLDQEFLNQIPVEFKKVFPGKQTLMVFAQNPDPVAGIAGSAWTPNASKQQSPPAGIWIFRTPRYYASKPFVAVITDDRTVTVFCGPVLPVPPGIKLY